MADAPRGTITLLFTDIEGSTQLLELLGDEYRGVLADHDRLLRAAVEAHGGYEVMTAGDSFFVAFSRAADAVAAVAAAQQELAARDWPRGISVRVRMGLHTGEPTPVDGNYVGIDVHRAARVMATGHGGQVILSQATRDTLGDADLGENALRDLGEHRLKDLTQPQRLYQLLLPGLPDRFPPLRTLESRPTNLPFELTPLVGRDRELEETISLLRDDGVRLLTLTGPGGTGKTRLAMQAAAELVDAFQGGVFYVALAAVSDAALVLPTIARTLGLRERAEESVRETLVKYVDDNDLLLVLDNVEQVMEVGADFVRLLEAASTLTLLVTSRSPLRVSGEREYAVQPLSLPAVGRAATPETVLRSDAVRLFVERARAVNPGFELSSENAGAVAEICVRLDGLPLAVELAAARVRVLPPRALLPRLEQRLRFLTGGARDLPVRQQTLRGAIDWSHELLSTEEQLVFRRVAVFVGGCTFEALEQVCSEEGIDVFDCAASLVEKSLVRQEEGAGGDSRLSMLETIREYALERLRESGEEDRLRRLHADWFLALAEEAAELLGRGDQAIRLAGLETEHDNLRAVLAWALEKGETQTGLRLASTLWRFWWLRGYVAEGRRWLQNLLGSGSEEPTAERADALRALGALVWSSGDPEAAKAATESSLALYRALDDAGGVARCLNNLGMIVCDLGDLDAAQTLLEECVALHRRSGDTSLLASTLANLGTVAAARRDFTRATNLGEESLELSQRIGDGEGIALALGSLALIALLEHRYDEARALIRESLGHARALALAPYAASDLQKAAVLAAVDARWERAARLQGACESLLELSGTALEPLDKQFRDTTTAQVRAELPEAEFAAASAEGRRMDLGEAVTYALEGIEAPND